MEHNRRSVHSAFTVATIRKLPSGKWNVQVRRKGYPAQTGTFRTLAAAERWARDKEDQADKGTLVDLSAAKETTVDGLMEKYLADITPRKRSKTPEASRIALLRRELGRHTLAGLTPEIVAQWARGRLKAVSSDTVRKELNTLSHAIDSAPLWSIHLPANPVTLARPLIRLAPGNQRERRLVPGEFRRLLKTSTGPHRALWVWLAESAMRRGEVAAMKPEHRRGDLLRIPDSKTGKPRTIPITRHMARAWKELPFGMKPDSITQAFDRACERAGIEGLRLHDLRHEATSRLFEKGLQIQEVAAITGHSDWASLKRYTHPSPDAIARKLAAARPGRRRDPARPPPAASPSSSSEPESDPPK